jgi:hypothetical protein
VHCALERRIFEPLAQQAQQIEILAMDEIAELVALLAVKSGSMPKGYRNDAAQSGWFGSHLPVRGEAGNVCNRRNPVIAAHPGEDPFTIPLRALLIVCCQPVVSESTTYVRGDAAGASGNRTRRPIVKVTSVSPHQSVQSTTP